MYTRLEIEIRQKKAAVARESKIMNPNTPQATREFALGYMYALQEVLDLIDLQKESNLKRSQTMFNNLDLAKPDNQTTIVTNLTNNMG